MEWGFVRIYNRYFLNDAYYSKKKAIWQPIRQNFFVKIYKPNCGTFGSASIL